jgi:calcium/calmodulin-dependent protein kinase I
MTTIHSILGKVTGQPSSYSKKHNYSFGKVLGAGTFGVVRQAKVNDNQENVAVKIILKKTLRGNEQMVLEEIKLLQLLHHPNIVAFKDWFESKDKFYIVTQMATGGELFDRIVTKGRFTEKDASKCVADIVDAVAYIHSRDIVHRDLKPENLLYVTEQESSDLVLADFGIAKSLSSPEEKLRSMAGSFGYAAPEVLTGRGHGKPCDIWSLGVISYTVLSGYSPFRSETVEDFLQEVSDDYLVVYHHKYWKEVSQDAKRFISSMLQVDPEKRPTAAQLLKDPWITGEAPHTTTDLLPGIRSGFNARQKFRLAIEAVRLANRIKALDMADEASDEEENGDGHIGLLNKRASAVSTASSTSSKKGLKFQEVVMAATRTKNITETKDPEGK